MWSLGARAGKLEMGYQHSSPFSYFRGFLIVCFVFKQIRPWLYLFEHGCGQCQGRDSEKTLGFQSQLARLSYHPQKEWSMSPQQECGRGKVIKALSSSLTQAPQMTRQTTSFWELKVLSFKGQWSPM